MKPYDVEAALAEVREAKERVVAKAIEEIGLVMKRAEAQMQNQAKLFQEVTREVRSLFEKSSAVFVDEIRFDEIAKQRDARRSDGKISIAQSGISMFVQGWGDMRICGTNQDVLVPAKRHRFVAFLIPIEDS